jgi:hypothetical protein
MTSPHTTTAGTPGTDQSAAQRRYAALLEWCTRIGLAVVVLAFAAYVLGLVPARVPVDRLAEVWHLPVAQYQQATGGTQGWGWIADLRRSDMAALAGIGLLAACSAVALLALVPLYLRRGDRVFAVLCMAEVAVIVLAASGWITAGH